MATHESLSKAEAAERTIQSGDEMVAALSRLGLGELAFRKAVAAPRGGDTDSNFFQIHSFYRLDFGGESPTRAEESLKELREYFASQGFDEGQTEGIRWLTDGYGDYSVHDHDSKLTYTMSIMKRHVGISLFVTSPPYEAPNPGEIFHPIRPEATSHTDGERSSGS